MRNSHLPFTVSARRLAALHSTLDSWGCALAPCPEYSRLATLLSDAQEQILQAILESKRSNSVRYRITLMLYDGHPHSIDDIYRHINMVNPTTKRIVQTYLADFVSEGWVRRIRNGVYQLIT